MKLLTCIVVLTCLYFTYPFRVEAKNVVPSSHKVGIKPYCYYAKCISVFDGDTCDVEIRVTDVTIHKRLRLFAINAPEMKGDEKTQGIISRDWLRSKILGKEIVVQTIKDKTGKYGRLLAVLWYNGVNLNQKMLDEGLARSYMAEKFPE